jgi:hypothetical protein
MRLSSVLLLGLLGAALVATPAEPRAQSAGDPPISFRLSADGDWLAAAGAGQDAGAILVAPLHPVPRGVVAGTLTIGGLFAVEGTDGPRVRASAWQQQYAPVLVPVPPPTWCQGMVGMVAHGAECALQAAPGTAPQPGPTLQGAGLSWSGGSLELALSAGRQTGWTLGTIAALPGSGSRGPGEAPGLLLPFGPGETRDLSAAGLWRVAPWGGVTFATSVGETQWQIVPGTAPLALDQAALQIGLAYGPFSGGITGRTLRLPNGIEPLWNGVDIGFSWRTPWRGELSIGAQNLVGRSVRDGLPAPAAPVFDEATARTPYVRYTQDL